MPNNRFTLYIPDLITIRARLDRDRHPLLEKFFARADASFVTDEYAVLPGLFGFGAEPLAAAPFTRLADGGRPDAAMWWRADPVHLLADRDQLIMLPQTDLTVLPDEARALAQVFNRHYEPDGLYLEVLHPQRWYLRNTDSWQCRTWNPALLEGGPVDGFMPEGAGGRRLRQIMNEVQMLFHEQPVNRAREAVGQPPINSLWLWGGGCLPEKPLRAPRRVITTLPLVKGLARFAGQASETWPVDLTLATDGETLLAVSVTDFSGDAGKIESSLLRPLWKRLSTGKLQELRWYAGGNKFYTLTRWGARRFWRRRRRLAQTLEQNNGITAY